MLLLFRFLVLNPSPSLFIFRFPISFLILLQLAILNYSMFLQIVHIFINNKCLVLRFVLYVLINLVNKLLHLSTELWEFLLYVKLVFVKLALDELEALTEEVLIVKNEFVDYCFVQFTRREFIWVSLINYWCKVCKVFWDIGGAILHY